MAELGSPPCLGSTKLGTQEEATTSSLLPKGGFLQKLRCLIKTYNQYSNTNRGRHEDEAVAHCHVQGRLSPALDDPPTPFGRKWDEIGILGEESRCRVRLDCNQEGLFKAIVDWPKRIYSNSKGESTKRDGEAPTSAGVLWNGASSVRRCTNIRGGFVQERALIPGLLPSTTGPSVLSESTGRWRVLRGFLAESLIRLQG